jgi:hypothetical protein
MLPKLTPNLKPGGSGNYSIVLLDDKEVSLNSYSFNVSFNYLGSFNGTYKEFFTDHIPFTFKIPLENHTNAIEIRNEQGDALYRKAISNNPPTVNLEHPNGGEVIEAGTVYDIQWLSDDADNDTIIHTVAYSDDGGENWIPLAFDHEDTRYMWNTSYLPDGSRYLIKVLASDGVNTAEDFSEGEFTILNVVTVVADADWEESTDSVEIIATAVCSGYGEIKGGIAQYEIFRSSNISTGIKGIMTYNTINNKWEALDVGTELLESGDYYAYVNVTDEAGYSGKDNAGFTIYRYEPPVGGIYLIGNKISLIAPWVGMFSLLIIGFITIRNSKKKNMESRNKGICIFACFN